MTKRAKVLISITLLLFTSAPATAETYIVYHHTLDTSAESWGNLYTVSYGGEPIGFEGSGVLLLSSGDALSTDKGSLIAIYHHRLALLSDGKANLKIEASGDPQLESGRFVLFGSGEVRAGEFSIISTDAKSTLNLTDGGWAEVELFSGELEVTYKGKSYLSLLSGETATLSLYNPGITPSVKSQTPSEDWAFGLVVAIYSELLTKAQANWSTHPPASAVQYETLLILDPENENLILNLGYLHFKQGESERALELFNRLTKLFPKKASFQLVMGVALCDLERYQEALTYLDRALALNPRLVQALNQKATALRRMGRYDEALQISFASLTIKPTAEARLIQALIHYDVGDKLQAEKLITEEVSARSEGADFWVEKGHNLIARGYTDLALTISQTLLKLDKRTLQAYILSARAYLAENRVKEAGAILDEMLSQMPDYDEGYRSKAQFLVKLDKSDEALSTIDEGLARVGRTPLLLAAKGVMLLKQERIDEALLLFQESLRNYPDDPLVRSLEGKCLVYLDRLEEGYSALWEALTLGIPPDPSIYSLLASTATVMENFSAGKEFFQKALTLSPHASSLVANLASLMAQMGEGESARRLVAEELLRSPDDYQLRLTDAILLYLDGRWEEAITKLDGIIADFPEKSPAVMAKGKVLISLGEVEEGLALVGEYERTASGEVSFREVGVVYLNLEMLDEAVSAFNKMTAASKNPARSAQKASELLMLSGYYGEARDYLEQGLQQGNLFLANSLIARMYLVQALLGEPTEIESLKMTYISSRGIDRFSDKVLDFLKGSVTADELLTSASTPKERGEALFWSATKALAEGDRDAVDQYLARVLDEGAPYGFARDMAGFLAGVE